MLLLIALAHAPLFLYTLEPGIMHRGEAISFFDQMVNLFGKFFIDNRARAMFAVLFGYGLVLAFNSQISKGKTDKDARKKIQKRCWYLIGFGFILAVVIGGQDILMAYGIGGLMVSWLLLRNNKTLIRTFIIVTICSSIVVPIIWGLFMIGTGDYGFPSEISATDTYFKKTLLSLITFPFIPAFIHLMIPVLPSILLGMWIARSQLLTNPENKLKPLYMITGIGLIISLLGALPLSLLGTTWHPGLFTAGLIYGVHILTGIAGGLAYAAIFGIIGAKLRKTGPFTLSIMALGKRSLTFYVWNEAMLVLFLSPIALDLGGKVSYGISALIAVGIWIFSVILATVLEKKNLNGPLEFLMRKLVNKNNRQKNKQSIL